MQTLKEKYETDKQTWNDCADTYERQIVGGHPDILAFEEFEEDFLDRLLRHLIRKQSRFIKLMDIGCGSGRLHLRYGTITTSLKNLPARHPLASLKKYYPKLAYDPVMAQFIAEVWGIDFSRNMIDLAKKKLKDAGLSNQNGIELTFEQGSAFELKQQPEQILPVAICLVNSIGVMQGAEGAKALFQSMRRAVEPANGIAIISCYQQEYINSYGLGQYESTLDVSGHPLWLAPDTYVSSDYKQIPRQYKLAHNNDMKIVVDVFDKQDRIIKEGHVLQRIPDKTKHTINTGDINTYSDYKSHWYSYEHIEKFIQDNWDPQNSFHVKTIDLDMLRAEPAQLAILDFSGYLKDLFNFWRVS